MSNNSFLHRFSESFQNGMKLIRKGHLSVVRKELLRRIYSKSPALGLQRDLEKPFQNPDAKIDISIRPFKSSDLEPLMEYGKLEDSYPRLAAYQKGLIAAEIPTCYVAVTKDDTPCYMQWLIGPEQNDKLRDHFGDIFPVLNENEALLEGAYMRPSFRRNGIMPAAMSRIAARAEEMGIRWVITFVGSGNIPSLKGCKRAGFDPYILREEQWLLFRNSTSFSEIPDNVYRQYRQQIEGKRDNRTNIKKKDDATEGKPQVKPKPASS